MGSPRHQTAGPSAGLIGSSATNSDQLLAMIPAILTAVGEIQSLLTGRRKEYYTVDEFADVVRRAPYTVRGWVRDGRVDAVRVTGTGPRGRLLIPRIEVTKIVQAGLGGQAQAGVND